MEALKKFGDEDSTTSETIDEVIKENETESEKLFSLVVNMITTIKEAQKAHPKQNYLTDRDLLNVNHDPKIVNRDPDIIDHKLRLREQPHHVIDLKGGGMLTKESEK